MPQKIRELKSKLQKAGFVLLKKRGKGSHTMWEHSLLANLVVISGKDGDDADRYQEREVRDALIELEKLKERGQD
jgi:predicted RNA binding protein YcfA (HicA-like mRNA interferase family)